MRLLLLAISGAVVLGVAAIPTPAASSGTVVTGPLTVTGQAAAAGAAPAAAASGGPRVKTARAASPIPVGAAPPVAPPGGPPPVKPPVSTASTVPTVPVAFDVPVQLTTLNSGGGAKITRVYLLCALASSPAVQIAYVTLPKGHSIMGVPSGGSGNLLAQASVTVPIDQNGSYSGPPVHIVVTPSPKFPGVAPRSYGCALVFNNALAANAPAADGSYAFVQSPFTASTQGTLP